MGRLGHRVPLHVDRDDRGPLFDGQAQQGALHHDRGIHQHGRVGGSQVLLIERLAGTELVAAQTIQARIDHNAIQPAADRGIMAKRPCGAVRREHRVLQRVVRVVGIPAGELRESVQLAVVAVEELLERVPVAVDVRDQQLGVGA